MILYTLFKGILVQVLHTVMVRRACCVFFFVFLVGSLISCKEDVGALNTTDSPLGEDYSLAFTDSISVRTSTVLLDSFPASNTGVLLVGKYADPKLGVVQSKPSFQISLGEPWTLAEDAIYDSLVLLMPYSGYYYGDTTKSQTVEVRNLLSELKGTALSNYWYSTGVYSFFDNNFVSQNSIIAGSYIYSHKVVNDSAVSIGSRTFTPRPGANDYLKIQIATNYGLKFFQKKKAGSNDMIILDRFMETFKGFSLTALHESNIIGLNVAACKVRLYYRESDDGRLVRKFHDFLLTPENGSSTPVRNYNNITADRSATLLKDLSKQTPEISSSVTNNETYVQSGLGVVTKLYFPGLRDILSLDGFKQITRARLVIEPVKNAYDAYTYLPNELVLFQSDRTNIPYAPLGADFRAEGFEFGRLISSGDGREDEEYSFIITQYLQNLLTSRLDQRDMVLLLSTPPIASGASAIYDRNGNVFKTVTRAVTHKARIEISYLKYNK